MTANFFEEIIVEELTNELETQLEYIRIRDAFPELPEWSNITNNVELRNYPEILIHTQKKNYLRDESWLTKNYTGIGKSYDINIFFSIKSNDKYNRKKILYAYGEAISRTINNIENNSINRIDLNNEEYGQAETRNNEVLLVGLFQITIYSCIGG